ncbi:response regulator transcription factor [Methylobacterium haplocladii]|uniref:DNA-binding response regulator n=1 Tax=Methylobacterium haplocladii TaxID=1176176 RepID=A0A512IR29_9HYPH|nr:response regulator transcription factor [Methylobacterium haplocladii]GEP00177.1 DNA-binding response regulator [Methylobacterium haplocladii]GJD83768.1 Transcriptional regulatory protein CusR [Methylobacterium haplocladii]GLS57977.1 DNA-binding response regulator [Methylobacterium haplocladii]
MKVLLIEDDACTAALVAAGLSEAGHSVEHAADGIEGLRLAREGSYDVAVVDRMLPGIDGLNLARMLRAAGIQTPLLFLTTMSGIDDRVDGLEAGGDDYLVKPYAFPELLARVNALGRRPLLATVRTVLRVADLEMDLIARKVRRAGRTIELQPREFQLLEFLLRNAGCLVTRRQLLENVWEFQFDPKTNIVETHMSRLRAKVDRGFDCWLIETVRGSGYLLRGLPS